MSDPLFLEKRAHDYLKTALGDGAPAVLTPLACFEEAPLEGEGAVGLFRFQADLAGVGERASYVVVAGETEPNYYPDWGLSPEECYEMHLGTRFMLVAEVGQRPLEELPDGVGAWFTGFFAEAAPVARVIAVEPRAAFSVNGETHVVARVSLEGETVWCVGLEAPPGIYRTPDLPPHVVYRRHLGRLIRLEWQQALKTEGRKRHGRG